MPETILLLCAHSDDEVLGAGGTIAKLAKEGKKVVNVIFSYGEKSHPWLKTEAIKKIREKEAKEADKLIGCKKTIFFDLKEGKYLAHEKEAMKKVMKILKKEKPTKIFTHSYDDPHPDHRAVFKIVMQTISRSKHSCDVYIFDVWNPFTIRQRNLPRLYVDITKEFPLKVKALKQFKSQKVTMISLLWSVYTRAINAGLHVGALYGERFYKIK
ncbi:MAG: PIG-L deacetylase family protein [Candidatus Woesearchaeota archaeon]